MSQSSDLAAAIVEQQPVTRRTATDLVESMRGELAKALPQHVGIDKFLRLALTELRMNPALGDASAESLLGALMTAARLGLDIGGPTGEFYLTPRRVRGEQTVVPIVGYRGLIALARRAGVGQISAQVVREGDHYAEGFTSDRGFYAEWTPKPGGDTSRPIVGVLAAAKLAGGDVQHRHLTIDEVHQRRDRGGFKSGGNSPWTSDFEAMVRKTALRALVPLLPQNTELALAEQVDEQVQTYPATDLIPTPAPETPEETR